MSLELACEGYGEKPAEFMFVGISAGKLGALRTKVPFTRDASGKIFQRVLYRLGLSETIDERDEKPVLVRCWVTNLVKGRVLNEKGNNRLPTEAEAEYWWPKMEQELKQVNPRIVVTLGEFVSGCFHRHNVWHLPLYHPRWYASNGAISPTSKAFRQMLKDYSRILDYFAESVSSGPHFCLNLNRESPSFGELRNMDTGKLR